MRYVGVGCGAQVEVAGHHFLNLRTEEGVVRLRVSRCLLFLHEDVHEIHHGWALPDFFREGG